MVEKYDPFTVGIRYTGGNLPSWGVALYVGLWATFCLRLKQERDFDPILVLGIIRKLLARLERNLQLKSKSKICSVVTLQKVLRYLANKFFYLLFSLFVTSRAILKGCIYSIKYIYLKCFTFQ